VSSVLVADDDDDLRHIIVECVADEGYTVLEARDGTQALALVLAEKPEIVILDNRMPGLSGAEVVRRVRDAGGDSAIILITAATDVAKLAAEVGVPFYLGKPFGLTDLVEVLRRARPALQTARAETIYR
jgi:two-component system, response regulator, stage 0 sporulation protein F